MELALDHRDGCRVRSWRMSDVPALVKYANNRKLWLNLRDRFPHPYRRADSRDYLSSSRERNEETFFAIDIDGEALFLKQLSCRVLRLPLLKQQVEA